MRKIIFYFWLLVKKVKTFLFIKFEKKVKNKYIIDDIDFREKLWGKILGNLVLTENKIFYNTKIKNRSLPNNLAQSRVLLSAVTLLKKKRDDTELKKIVNSLKNYLLSVKTKDNIWLFNQKSWNKQDEGIATIWVLISLLEVYNLNMEEELLNEILESTQSLHKLLYNRKKSLVHNIGDNFWCLNAASTYAMYIGKLLDISFNKEFVEKLNMSVKLCIDNITEDGFFPYSELRSGTYLLLYNPIVIITLEEALKSIYIETELKERSLKQLERVKKYIYQQKDEDYYFIEPEQKKFSRYIISNITSLIALRNILSKDEEKKIFDNVKSYMINNRLYLCRNENGEYFNGNLYEVKDVLLTELFFWLNFSDN